MRAKRWVPFFGACLVFVCAECTAVAHAQAHAQARIVANVELVQIPFIIFDEKGAVATNLKKTDFQVSDDGDEQNILYLERERVPVSFVILADLSSSMTRKIPFVQEAALELLDPLQEEDHDWDEYAILSIGKRAKRLIPFTHDQRDLERRLPLVLTPTNESTALFDSLWLGERTARREAMNRHRAIIVITDGGDNHSRYNLRETKRLLEEADVTVFTVMAGPSFELPEILLPQEKKGERSPPGTRPKPQFPNLPIAVGDDYIGPAERRGPHNMKVLSEVTGGGVFTAHHQEDLPRIVRTIGLAVRYQYVLTYKPVHDGRFTNAQQNLSGESIEHKVVVQLRPKEKFRGYGLPYYKRSYRSAR